VLKCHTAAGPIEWVIPGGYAGFREDLEKVKYHAKKTVEQALGITKAA
jgi:hypothetical protein